MLHKPGGVTSTVRDRHASKTVLDMIPTAMLPRAGASTRSDVSTRIPRVYSC
jgi:16S rRNA U516 pseudouridylate synthase RsuA-like enzyme